MDAAKLRAIHECGNCHQPEEAHWHKTGTGTGELALFAALGGACTHFVVSDAALAYQQHLALADRDPQPRYGGPRARRRPLCERCGRRGHQVKDCTL